MMMQTNHNPPSERAGSGRLTLLLTHNDWRDETPLHRLPHLLEPLGIECIDVGNAEEAADVIQQVPVPQVQIQEGIRNRLECCLLWAVCQEPSL